MRNPLYNRNMANNIYTMISPNNYDVFFGSLIYFFLGDPTSEEDVIIFGLYYNIILVQQGRIFRYLLYIPVVK